MKNIQADFNANLIKASLAKHFGVAPEKINFELPPQLNDAKPVEVDSLIRYVKITGERENRGEVRDYLWVVGSEDGILQYKFIFLPAVQLLTVTFTIDNLN